MNEKLNQFYEASITQNEIANPLYKQFDVKKGLRNEDGTGVRVGLTRIADVVGYRYDGDTKQDDEGQLYYRGMAVQEIIENRDRTYPCAFEETCFLLLFGKLPNQEERQDFIQLMHEHSELPEGFVESSLLRLPVKEIMNRLQQAVLTLYSYDDHADDSSPENTLRQGIDLIAKLPAIIAYAYQSKMHYFHQQSLIIHHIDPSLTFAQSILSLMRPDRQYTKEEADLLDMMLVLHADHGGGNNSTFTNVVIASTGTDVYSAIAGSIGAMKGPRHGGANERVCEMLDAVKETIEYDCDDQAIEQLIKQMLNKEFFDHSGLVYGFGHAVYTKSDPRCVILKQQAAVLATDKGREEEFQFLQRFEKIAKRLISEQKGKSVCANVDFYSGFVYDLLDIPRDLYTPMFVMARMVGWLAHNIENKLDDGRIVRPATKYVGELQTYIKMEDRT